MERLIPPNFDVVLEMLIQPDSNFSFFAASKLKSIVSTLKIADQREYIPELISRLSELRQSAKFIERCDEQTIFLVDQLLKTYK